MIKRVKILNWLICGYIALRIFGYSLIVDAIPSFRILFVVLPILLFIWQALIVRARFNEPTEEAVSHFYNRLETGDWVRVLVIMLIGSRPLASDYVWGFWLYSAVVTVFIAFVIGAISIEFSLRRTITTLVIGCLIFAGILLWLEKSVYVVHYGVPIIGHFLEKPEYDAKYQVEVESADSHVEYEAIADIHVGGRTETEEAGEDYFGQMRYSTTTYREAWVKRLYFPNGGSVEIEVQDEPLYLGESVFVEDTHGKKWYVKLLPEPIP
jgi:hypothetical protein